MKDTTELAQAHSTSTAFIRRLGSCGALLPEDAAEIAEIPGNRLSLRKGVQFVREGKPMTGIYILHSGWAMQYMITREGRRQVTGVAIPGDILGLHCAHLGVSQYTAESLDDTVLSVIEPERMIRIIRKSPHLSLAMSKITARDMALVRGHALRLGRLTAEQRIAHFLAELWHRQALVGETEGEWMRMPMTQTEMSDHLGLSLVHTNRQLQQLRRRGLIESRRNFVRVKNLPALEEIGEFRPEFAA